MDTLEETLRHLRAALERPTIPTEVVAQLARLEEGIEGLHHHLAEALDRNRELSQQRESLETQVMELSRPIVEEYPEWSNIIRIFGAEGSDDDDLDPLPDPVA